MTVHLLSSIAALRAYRKGCAKVALVPTMGSLHAGHLRLVEVATQQADQVIVSLFVNRLQFGPNEDFERYPRDLEADCTQLSAGLCDAVFAPEESELFQSPQSVQVIPPLSLADDLCGAFRPGHFAGVCTIVAKLLNVIQPEIAVFGLKDYQQWIVLQHMVTQLNFPVQLSGVETVREADGLALSSRNRYLTTEERQKAPLLYRALQQTAERLQAQPQHHVAILDEVQQPLTQAGWKMQYLCCRDAAQLGPVTEETAVCVLLAAGWLGKTRLIDQLKFALF